MLPPGNYEIVVTVTNDGVSTHGSVIPVVVGDANQDLGTVTLVPSVALTGQILLANPLSVRRNQLWVNLHMLEPTTNDYRYPLGRGGKPPEIRSDGSFTLPGLLPGLYQVQITATVHLIPVR